LEVFNCQAGVGHFILGHFIIVLLGHAVAIVLSLHQFSSTQGIQAAQVIQAESFAISSLCRCVMNFVRIEIVNANYTRSFLCSGCRNHSLGDCHKESHEGVKTGKGYWQH